MRKVITDSKLISVIELDRIELHKHAILAVSPSKRMLRLVKDDTRFLWETLTCVTSSLLPTELIGANYNISDAVNVVFELGYEVYVVCYEELEQVLFDRLFKS